MLSDRQVRKLRNKLAEGKTVLDAAAAADMSEKSAHKWKEGRLPSQVREGRSRWWRTRPDPLAEVWDTDLVPLLQVDEKGALEATELLRVLDEKYPGRFGGRHLRTLQRRVSEWRAHHGPEKEIYFEQVHPPGREAAFDFTNCTDLGVTILGVLLVHLLFDFVLSFSKWRWVCVAYSETFEAMVHGLQGAVWELGGVPAVWRSDNLSAATHQLPGGGRELTRRYQAVIDHYGVKSTRIEPGKSNQNGVAEKSNDLLKRRIEQALIRRGSRDFESVAEYEAFARGVSATMNRDCEGHLVEERRCLLPLPSEPVPEYMTYWATVRCWSTIHFAKHTYSVPSRLKGKELEVRQYADVIELWYAKKLSETMPRIRGEKHYRIDYRHVIWSLVRKPGAFARYRYREELFPTLTFRRAYDALVDARGERADVEYVRILHLAASTMEADVERALAALLERGERFDYVAVKALAAPDKPAVPEVHIPPPDLSEYDRLLACGGGDT
jgi:hypothetical protein